MGLEFDQVSMLGFDEELSPETKEIISEVFQDPTPISEIKKGNFLTHPLPDEVKKGRSNLIDEVISTQNEQEYTITNDEISEITKKSVATRISLSFDDITCSRALTNFDREVIDAVSSLAPNMQIMTSAMIYRVITGKDSSFPVNQGQKKRVEDSMNRCMLCQIKIDLTPRGNNHNEKFEYTGNAISFEAIKHQVGRGSTTYYKINSMPPTFRLAEKLGKVSVIPLKLLDSPVSKTDGIIAAQSYLLREIDEMKRSEIKINTIFWDKIYTLSAQEGKQNTKQENKRTRDTILKILDFWVNEKFIVEYQSFPRKNIIEIRISA